MKKETVQYLKWFLYHQTTAVRQVPENSTSKRVKISIHNRMVQQKTPKQFSKKLH